MFKRGDKVNVFNSTLSGRIILEGRATLIAPVEQNFIDDDEPETWMVRFPDDGVATYRRVIVPGKAQHDPEGYINDCKETAK